MEGEDGVTPFQPMPSLKCLWICSGLKAGERSNPPCCVLMRDGEAVSSLHGSGEERRGGEQREGLFSAKGKL